MSALDLTEEQKRLVWSVLVDECGARPNQWDEFVYHFPQCREFRFMGHLGFGGKVWADSRRVYVTCYSEDATDERTDMIGAANSALLRISAGPPRPDRHPAPRITRRAHPSRHTETENPMSNTAPSRGLVIVDVETTGLEPHDICVEVGWYDLRTSERGSFVPAHDVDWVLANAHPRALEVNGYRDRLTDAPQDDGTELRRLHERLAGQALGGSNVRTDADHTARLFDAAGLTPREPWHYHLAELSSYACGVLGRPITDPPGLWTCCEALGVDPESDVHTAEGGATTTALCFVELAIRAALV